ncbi:MAG TPA: hypothetical protein VL523_15425 [Terriglobia bacterium]|nr:hypothetical protein [Terriglobia bacterium]
MSAVTCWKCGNGFDLAPGARVGTRETCPRCDSDLHACRNCRHYNPAKHNQCAETQAEWVRDKEASNYCDYFSPASSPGAAVRAAAPGDDARKKFDSLFKL